MNNPRAQLKRRESAGFTMIIMVMITLASCDFLEFSPFRPREDRLSFQKMEVQYTLSWPFADITYETEIAPTGLVKAQLTGGDSTGQTVVFDTGAYVLSEAARNRLEELFYRFEQYERRYTFNVLDGKYHHLTLIYDGRPDTVTVHEPWSGNLPQGLTDILSEMKRVQENALAE